MSRHDPGLDRRRYAPSRCLWGGSSPALASAGGASAAQAEADRHGNRDLGLGHARREGRQRGAAHHPVYRGVEFGKSRAPCQLIGQHAPVTVDAEAQNRAALLAALPRAVGIDLVAFQPGAERDAVIRADRLGRGRRGRRPRRGHRRKLRCPGIGLRVIGLRCRGISRGLMSLRRGRGFGWWVGCRRRYRLRSL